jgi:plastocyanin domain-containing protein
VYARSIASVIVPAALFFSTHALATKPAEPEKAAEAGTAAKAAPRRIKVAVTQKGFEPSRIEAKAGETLVLAVTRTTDKTCATSIVVPDQKIRVELPKDKEVAVTVAAEKVGSLAFGCQMGLMISGSIDVKK